MSGIKIRNCNNVREMGILKKTLVDSIVKIKTVLDNHRSRHQF